MEKLGKKVTESQKQTSVKKTQICIKSYKKEEASEKSDELVKPKFKWK